MKDAISTPTTDPGAWPSGDGEMAGRIRAHDWASTPLGPIGDWPQPLRTAVSLMLGAAQPVYIAWGPELTSLYNDGYLPIVGTKHPGIGLPFCELWAGIWDEFRPIVEATMAGDAQHFVDMPIALAGRPGVPVGFFTFSYTALHDDEGRIAGFYCAAVETTDRVQTERALRESEARLGLAVEIGGVGHWELDLSSGELTTSALCRMNFGRPADAPFSYEDLRASIHPEDRDRQQRTIAAAIESRSAFDTEYRLLAPGGELRWAEIRGRFEDGDGERLVGVSLDITGRKRAEEALRESEERQGFLLKLSDAVRPLAGPADIQGETTRLLREQLNAGWCYYVDWDVDGETGHVLRDSAREGLPSLAGEHDVSDAPEFLQLQAGGKVLTVRDYASYEQLPARIRRNFAALGFRSMMAAPLFKQGRLIASLLVGDTEIRDWTASEASLLVDAAERTWAALERGRAEAALSESEEKFRTVFEASDQGFAINEMIRDDTGQVIDCRMLEVNPAFARQTGLGPETVGKLTSEFLPDLERTWLETYDRVARTGKSERFEEYNHNTQGWYDVHVTAAGGEGRRVAIFFQDITARKRAEQVLRENEERQAFLLKLSDAIRPHMKADAVGALATRMVAEHLGVDRCYIARFAREEEKGWVGPEFRSSGLPALTGEYRFADFPEIIKRMETDPLAIRDGLADRSLSQTDRQSYQALGLRAVLTAPLRRGEDNAVWSLTAAETQPRDWTDGELKLLEDVAERTWAAIERARAEAALRESEEQFREQFENANDFIFTADLDMRITSGNPSFARALGVRVEDLIGRSISEFVPPEMWERNKAMFAAKLSGEAETTRYEVEVFDPGGERMTWEINSRLTRDASGAPAGLHAIGRDITERKRAQDMVRESGERLRLIFDSLDEYAIFTLDRHGIVTSWNEGAQRLLGYSEAEAVGMDGRLIFTPEDRAERAPEWEIETALAEGRAANERWHVRQNGSRFWGSGAVLSMLDGNGNRDDNGSGNGEPVLVKIMRDETYRVRAEEHQQLLLAELQHRVRNVLGIVRSLARQSMLGYSAAEDYVAHLVGRVDAMARTQVLLTHRTDARVSLEGLVREELAAQGGESAAAIDGPEVMLSPKAAEVITLALHELATNSVKYGSLGSRNGRLQVRWTLTTREGDDWVDLLWKEDVPLDAAEPARRGFGSDLIEHRVPYELRGTATLDIGPEGVRAEIGFPILDRGSILETGPVREPSQ